MEAQFFADGCVNVFEILEIGLGDDDVVDAQAQGREALFFEAADGHGIAAKIDLPGHGEGVLHAHALQYGKQHGRNSEARAGAVFGDSAFGEMDVEIPLLEQFHINSEGFAAAADVAQSCLGAFFHHIAQLAREDQTAFAGHGQRLDEQHFAAGAGPREPRDDADARHLEPLVRQDFDGP